MELIWLIVEVRRFRWGWGQIAEQRRRNCIQQQPAAAARRRRAENQGRRGTRSGARRRARGRRGGQNASALAPIAAQRDQDGDVQHGGELCRTDTVDVLPLQFARVARQHRPAPNQRWRIVGGQRVQSSDQPRCVSLGAARFTRTDDAAQSPQASGTWRVERSAGEAKQPGIEHFKYYLKLIIHFNDYYYYY